MRFLRAFFWEFVQNLPLVAGVLYGLFFWQQARVASALACMVVGSILGAVIIWATEARIVSGHHEPWQVVVTNMIGMAALMLLVVVYWSAPWSSWWTDVGLGLLAGTALAVAQDLAAKARIGVGHALALAVSLALALVGVRLLARVFPVWLNVLWITLTVTAVICWLDYREMPVEAGSEPG